MKKITLLLIFSAFLMGQHQRGGSRQRPAIGVLEGVVIDSSTSTPIEYASVSVSKIRDGEIVAGSVTNKQGFFKVKEIPLGRYRMVVEFIGYEKIIIEPINLYPGEGGGIEQDLGTIA